MRFDLTDATRPGIMFAGGYDILSQVKGRSFFEYSSPEDPERILRLGDTSKRLTITVSTRDGTAKGGEDFVSQNREITFAPLEVEKSLSIQLLDDYQFEPDEHFYLLLSGREVTEQAELEVRVWNDDAGAILDSPHFTGGEMVIPIVATDNPGQWKLEASFDLKKWTTTSFTL